MPIVKFLLEEKEQDGTRRADATLADNEFEILLSGFRPNTSLQYTIGSDARKKTGTFSVDADGGYYRKLTMAPALATLMANLGAATWNDLGSKWGVRAENTFFSLEVV